MKSLDIIQLYKDYNISFLTSGNKHCSPSWIQINCPFCEGSKDYHLGFHKTKEYFNCWRCGGHKLDSTIAALTGFNIFAAKDLINQYRTGRAVSLITPNNPQRTSKVILPGAKLTPIDPKNNDVGGHFSTLSPEMVCHGQALAYLEKRGFKGQNLVDLLDTYNLHFTGPVGMYNFRIIAPIYFNGELVSYQGRDYTGKSQLRYMACKKSEEVKDHKNCLYAMDLATTDTVVIVEGIVDQWKLGKGAVATCGQAFTLPQVKLLVKRWPHRVVLYDKDAVKAKELANVLSGFSGKTELACLNNLKDPGELTVEMGREVMKKLEAT